MANWEKLNKEFNDALKGFDEWANKIKQARDSAENDAINFTEWLNDGGWRRRDVTHPNRIGHYWSDVYFEHKSLKDLYSEYINSKPITTLQ